MQRVRRDSASSTDSWSIIEQRCSPEVKEEEDLSSEENDLDTDSEIEIGEEAFDSHDSDIEVDNRSIHDEEESEEEEEEEDEVEEEEMGEEDQNGESEEEEEEDQQDWGVVSEHEAMKGEGKHFVAPERIRGRLDSINRNKDSNRRLFLKASLGCFLAQNAVLLGLLLFSKPISNPQQHQQHQKTSPSDFVIFEWRPFNASSLQRCWPKTRVSFNLPSTTRSPPPSWMNFTLPSKEVYTFPSLSKTFRPTVYKTTTISRRSKPENTCMRIEKPPTVPKSLFPCQQTSSAPFDAVSSLQTLPEKYNLSALESIIRKKNEMIEKVWKKNAIFSGKGEKKMSSAFEKKIREPLKAPCFPKKIAPTKTEIKPRGRTFNYKMELIPVKKTKNIVKFTPIKEMKKSYWLPRREILRLQQQMKKKNKNALSISQKAMSVYDSRRKKMNKKYTNFRIVKNSSNTAKKQCARRDFKRLQLDDKSHKKRLLEYKIEKPCRAIFVKNTKERKAEEKKMEKKKWQKNVTKKNDHGRRLKKSFSL